MLKLLHFARVLWPVRTGYWLAGLVLFGVVGLSSVLAQPAPATTELKELRTKAEHADLEAQNALGNAYTNALLGVKQDFGEALKWYRAAAEKGYAPAQFNLGLACELGRGQPADEREAFKYYLKAAEQGFAAAQFNVGNMYSAGRGVGQDLFEANLWFKQAAEQGVLEAQFNLGLAYEAGRGVKKDEAQAARWYKQAADRGFVRAQYNLGLLFEDGRGVPKNETTAADLYRVAAGQGFASAQNNYGVMISEGRGGLAKDPVQAFVWLSLAAENGANPAARDFAGQSLSPDQRATAVQLLAERKGGKPSRPAVAPTPLAVAFDNVRPADAPLAESNQRGEREAGQLAPALPPGSAAGKLIEQLREQSRRLAEQVQSLTVEKTEAESKTALLAVQVKDAWQELEQQKTTTPAGEAARLQGVIGALTAQVAEATGSLGQLKQANQQLTETNARVQLENETRAAAKPVPATGPAIDRNSAPPGDLASSLTNLQRDNARLNDEVKRSTRELLSLNQQLRTLRSQAGQPAAAAGTDNAATAEMRSENQRVDTNNARLQGQRDSAVSDAQNLTGQLNEARGEITRLNEQIQQLRSTRQSADAASDQVGQLTSKAALAAAEAARLQTENNLLAARIAALEKSPPSAPPADPLAPQLAQVRQQVQALQVEKAGLDKIVQEKTAAIQSTDAETAALRQKLAQADKQAADAVAALGAQEQITQQLGADNRALTERTRRAEESLAAHAAQPAVEPAGPIKRQLAEVSDRAEGLTRENQTLTAELANEHANYGQAQTRVTTLENDLRRAQQKSADSAGRDDLKKQLAEVSGALEKNGATVAELTATNAGLEKELASAKQGESEIRTLHTELTKLRSAAAEVAALRAGNSRLRKTVDEASAGLLQRDQLARDSEQLSGTLSSTRHDLALLQTRVAELDRQLEEARTIRTHGGEDTKKLQGELAEANLSIEKLNAAVAELTGVNDGLVKDLDSARKSTAAALAAQSQADTAARPDAYKMEISTLQAHVKELEGQMEDERNNTAKEIGTLAAQLQRTRETNKSLTEANRALLSAKQSEQPTVDQAQFDQLQSKVRDLTTVADEMHRQNQKLTDDNQRLATERESFKQQLEDARKVATVLPGLAEEKAALQERLEAVGTQLMKSQQEVDALQKEKAEATAQLTASQQMADKIQAELLSLQSRTTDAEKASEAHNATAAELTQANTKLELEREDMRRLVESYRADITRLTQSGRSAEQQRVEAERGAQQNIDAVTAQLGQMRRELESARTAQSRMVEANTAQERERVAIITQLRTENGALAARLNQAQSTLDQIASTARLGTPAATIAAGGIVPVRPVRAASAPTPEVRYHTVTEGDSLSRISLRYYGTPSRWQEIFQANRDLLQGSSTLRVGMQLRIP